MNDAAFDTLYDELKRAARRQLGGARGTLCTTALVHEAWLKLGDHPAFDRQHYIALASRAMRQVAIDHARAAGAAKRGGGIAVTTLLDHDAAETSPALDALLLDEALAELEGIDPRCARVVEFHFFGGFQFNEIATTLGVSDRTVRTLWRTARAFLGVRLRAPG